MWWHARGYVALMMNNCLLILDIVVISFGGSFHLFAFCD